MDPGVFRVAAAYVVGTILTWLAESAGILIDEETSTALVQGMTLFFSTGYYVLVRLLANWWPGFEWLLGVPRTPVYVRPGNARRARKQMDVMDNFRV